MQQLGIQVVFAHILPGAQHAGRALHGADVGLRTDGAGAAHDVLLMRVLEQAHLVEQGAQVVLLGGANGAIAHPPAHHVEPALHACSQAAVGSKRVPDAGRVFKQARQLAVQLRHRMRGVHAQGCGRSSRAQAVAVPDFALQVLGLAEQRAAAIVGQHQAGAGLGEAGQVIEVAVVAEQKVAVPVARTLQRRGDDGNALGSQLGSQVRTALGIDGGRHGGIHGASRERVLSSASRSGVPTSVQRPV